MTKIFIDAGHGGNDGGAQGNGLSEKNLTLTIAKKIEAFLRDYENVTVKLSRTGDQTLSLSQRTNSANAWGADIFLSIHINSTGGKTNGGFESYIYNGNVSAKTVSLQNVVHQEIMRQIGGIDRGKKRANFHVTRESKMPALLTENLFIVHNNDASKLKQDSFLDKLALGHVIGLEKFLGLKKSKQPPKTTTTTASKTGSLYKVQIGAFSDLGNAEDLAEKAKKAGFNVFIDKQ